MQSSPYGLPNVGNSCFLNLIVQMIHRAPELSNLLYIHHRSRIVRSLHHVLLNGTLVGAVTAGRRSSPEGL